MLADLDSRGSGNLDSRTVTICSGLDLVNISYNNFVAADEKTAKVSHCASVSSGTTVKERSQVK